MTIIFRAAMAFGFVLIVQNSPMLVQTERLLVLKEELSSTQPQTRLAAQITSLLQPYGFATDEGR